MPLTIARASGLPLPAAENRARTLLAFARGILREAGRRAAVRRARRALLEMPDHVLADMGISRGEVHFIVGLGRPDPTRIAR